ncbi:hypothetical protein CEXT_194841 [Caerostris extrusa]|uniref:Uncharacterized protein n=1 Tax=Caerostris extrusa TaxID=172846 RepID=A0AAV4W1N2_CAEEX|nr:hypothetical protein CEXT_194841 [Caerostris extrusa]
MRGKKKRLSPATTSISTKNALFTTSPPQTNVVEHQLLPGQKAVVIDESATSYSISLQGRRSRGDEIPPGRSGPRQIRQEIPSGHFEGRERKKVWSCPEIGH